MCWTYRAFFCQRHLSVAVRSATKLCTAQDEAKNQRGCFVRQHRIETMLYAMLCVGTYRQRCCQSFSKSVGFDSRMSLQITVAECLAFLQPFIAHGSVLNKHANHPSQMHVQCVRSITANLTLISIIFGRSVLFFPIVSSSSSSCCRPCPSRWLFLPSADRSTLDFADAQLSALN